MGECCSTSQVRYLRTFERLYKSKKMAGCRLAGSNTLKRGLLLVFFKPNFCLCTYAFMMII